MALGAVALLLCACSTAPSHSTRSFAPKFRGVSGCGATDTSASMAAYLSSRPANSTVTLPHNACFTFTTTMLLENVRNLTINGNGATFALTTQDGGFVPIMELWNDTGIKFTGLTFDGGATPSDPGGEADEGDYGIQMEADTNITFTGDTIQNVQGDWIFLQQPIDVPNTDPQINTGITFSRDTFLNAGYHGLTVESVGCPTTAPCNGLTVANSKLSNMAVDAMDFEVDDFDSGFAANGAANFSVENDVSIVNNVWANWGYDWFASIQGQEYNTPITTSYGGTANATVSSVNGSGNLLLSAPIDATNPITTNTTEQSGVGVVNTSAGLESLTYQSWSGSTLGGVHVAGSGSATIPANAKVIYGDDCPSSAIIACGGVAEQNLVMTGNVLNGDGAFMEVVGTQLNLTTQPYTDDNWTITNNRYGTGYYAGPYRGGNSAAMSVFSVSHFNMTNNLIPFCPGGEAPCNDTPNEYVMELFGSNYSTIKSNTFTGAAGTRQPEDYNAFDYKVTICGNKILSGSTDASC